MKRSVWLYTCLCVFFSAQLSCAARSVLKETGEDETYQEAYPGIGCEEPERPEHSDVTGSGEFFPVGSVLHVICHEGFSLRGPSTMHCVAMGNRAVWDPVGTRECVAGTGNFDEEEGLLQSLSEEPEPEVTEEEMLEIDETEETPIQAELHEKLQELSDTHLPPYMGGVYLPEARNVNNVHVTLEEGELTGEELEFEMNRPLAEVLDITPDFCLLPPQTGPCKAHFLRFYFDKSTGECRSFVYGGCSGNENRFMTQDDCDKACVKQN